MLFLIDLDGTLLDTDHLHYQAWANVLNSSCDHIERIVTTHGINYILEDFPDPAYMRRRKIREMLHFENIKLMKHADSFINFILENDIEHVVVTNTDRKVVEHFKRQVPILNKLKKMDCSRRLRKPKTRPRMLSSSTGRP